MSNTKGKIVISLIKKIVSRRNFTAVDFVTLKTAMMLAALDGEVSGSELASFREMALNCRGCTPKSFAKLWDEALRSTGYLLIQSKILTSKELVALFVREAESSFVGEISSEVSDDRQHAFDVLTEMAKADGEFSEIEREAIAALETAVENCRRELVNTLCPLGAR